MKNKSVQNCQFVHHAKFHCIMTMLNRLFKIEFERGGGGELEKSRKRLSKCFYDSDCIALFPLSFSPHISIKCLVQQLVLLG